MTSLQIKNFLCCASNSSFSQSAEKLFISVNSLTQQMSLLEEELGFKLFVRTKRGILLTEEGKVFRNGIEELSNKMEKLLHDCRTIGEKQCIYTCIPKGGRVIFMKSVMERMAAEHPDIGLVFTPTDNSMLEMLISNVINFAILPEFQSIKDNPDLLFIPMFESTFCLIHTAQKGKELGEKPTIEKLRSMDIILDDIEWLELFPQDSRNFKSVTIAKGSNDVFAACSEGKIYLLPEAYAELYAPLKVTPFEELGKIRTGAVVHKDTPYAVKCFLSCMEEVLEQIRK